MGSTIYKDSLSATKRANALQPTSRPTNRVPQPNVLSRTLEQTNKQSDDEYSLKKKQKTALVLSQSRCSYYVLLFYKKKTNISHVEIIKTQAIFELKNNYCLIVDSCILTVYRGATGAARAPNPDKTSIMAARHR